MRRWRLQMGGLAIAGLLAAANGWADDPAAMPPEAGVGSPYDSGVVQLYGHSSMGTNSDFGRIQLYQFTLQSGPAQPGTLYRFGSIQQNPLQPGITPMIAGPPMRVAPFIPMVPMLPVLPNGGMAPVVPHIGVITPGPAPGTSTWGKGR